MSSLVSFLTRVFAIVGLAVWLALGFLVGSAALAQELPADASANAPAPEAATESLTIITASGPHHFDVEVMRTPNQLAKGLMFRRHMAPDHGMLFDFKKVQPVMMWMRNTYLPLDMVFIAASGKVVSVAADTKPLSDHIITSGGPVLGVLEVNAGTVARIGLKPGDKVVYPLFKK